MTQKNGILMEFQLRIYPVKYRQHGISTFSIIWKFDGIFKTAFQLHGIGKIHHKE